MTWLYVFCFNRWLVLTSPPALSEGEGALACIGKVFF